jgi:hypothetical protein
VLIDDLPAVLNAAFAVWGTAVTASYLHDEIHVSSDHQCVARIAPVSNDTFSPYRWKLTFLSDDFEADQVAPRNYEQFSASVVGLQTCLRAHLDADFVPGRAIIGARARVAPINDESL